MGLIGDIVDYVIPKTQQRAAIESKSFREILDEELIKIGCNPGIEIGQPLKDVDYES